MMAHKPEMASEPFREPTGLKSISGPGVAVADSSVRQSPKFCPRNFTRDFSEITNKPQQTTGLIPKGSR